MVGWGRLHGRALAADPQASGRRKRRELWMGAGVGTPAFLGGRNRGLERTSNGREKGRAKRALSATSRRHSEKPGVEMRHEWKAPGTRSRGGQTTYSNNTHPQTISRRIGANEEVGEAVKETLDPYRLARRAAHLYDAVTAVAVIAVTIGCRGSQFIRTGSFLSGVTANARPAAAVRAPRRRDTPGTVRRRPAFRRNSSAASGRSSTCSRQGTDTAS